MEILIQAKSLDAMTSFYINIRHCYEFLNLGTQLLADNIQVFATEDRVQLTTEHQYSEQLGEVMRDIIPNDDVFVQIRSGEDHILIGYNRILSTETENPQFISIAEIEQLIQDIDYDFEVEEAPLISDRDFTPTVLDADVKCSICLGEYTQMQRTVCDHLFCDGCAQSLITYQYNNCPMCRADLIC